MTSPYQLPLDLGPIPSAADTELDLGPAAIVVCYQCTGPHPVERCPARVVCFICTGNHRTTDHR